MRMCTGILLETLVVAPARFLLSRTLRSAVVGRSRKYTLAIGELYRAGVAGIGAVFGTETIDRGGIANFQRIPAPALTSEGVGRPTFALPMGDCAAVVLGVQINPDVR